MKSLFRRILGLILCSFFGVAILSTLAFKWVSHELDPHERHFHERSLKIATQAVSAYEAGDVKNFRQFLREEYDGKFWLLNLNDVSVFGRPPPRISSQVKTYPTILNPSENVAGRFFVYAHLINGGNAQYKVIMTPSHPKLANRGTFVWGPVLLVLLALVAASTLIGMWILKPVRAIRNSPQQLSSNNFNQKVPEAITKRKDAFGELGKEFNLMSKRVQDTIDSQNQLLRDVSHEL